MQKMLNDLAPNTSDLVSVTGLVPSVLEWGSEKAWLG